MKVARDSKSLDKGLPTFCFSFSARRAGEHFRIARPSGGNKTQGSLEPRLPGTEFPAKIRPPSGRPRPPRGHRDPHRFRGHPDRLRLGPRDLVALAHGGRKDLLRAGVAVNYVGFVRINWRIGSLSAKTRHSATRPSRTTAFQAVGVAQRFWVRS
jgi:hypothetical protein